jgi:hypothetical protein
MRPHSTITVQVRRSLRSWASPRKTWLWRLASLWGIVEAPFAAKAKWDWVQLPFRFSLLFEHDLFRKPVSTFRDHALSAAFT